jgi:hypothetical protein
MSWRQRERWFYWGAPLAVAPALVFLPLLATLVLEPRVPYGPKLALVILPLFLLSEAVGVKWLVQCCLERPFNLLSLLAAGALMILIVIAACIGLFLAAFTLRI